MDTTQDPASGSVDGEISIAFMSVKGKPVSGSVDGETIPSMSVKDFEALIETAIVKSMKSFRDEFEKLLEDRLNHYSNRLAAVETLNQDQDRRIRELDMSLNEMTDRYFGMETRMDTVQKTADKFSDSSIVKLQGQITENLALTNDVEQYSRRLNIRIHGMTEVGDDHIDTVRTLIREKLHVECSLDDIEAAHPLPTRSPRHASARSPQTSSQSFIVRFRRNQKRLEVLKGRRQLKGSGISISEDLTNLNSQLLKRLHTDVRIENAWSWEWPHLCNCKGVG